MDFRKQVILKCFTSVCWRTRPPRSLLALWLASASLTAFPGSLTAGEHLVPRSDLHKSIVTAQQEREANRAQILAVLSTPQVKRVLKSSKLEYEKIEKAVPFLSDEDLEQLAVQTQKLKTDLAAGALDNQQLTYIVIALGTAIIVILAT